jgi:putative flippase GtrA
MSSRTRWPPVVLDLLVLVVMTRLFFAINVFSLSAVVAFVAILLVLVLLNHRWVFAAKQTQWNFVELRETDFMITAQMRWVPPARPSPTTMCAWFGSLNA